MVEVAPESSSRASMLLQSRFFLEQKKLPAILRGLPDDATNNLITGRMMEIIPREPKPEDFVMLVTMTEDPGLDYSAREALRNFAYDPSYPHAAMALRALATIEGSARRSAQRTSVERPIEQTRQTIIGTTMGQTLIS